MTTPSESRPPDTPGPTAEQARSPGGLVAVDRLPPVVARLVHAAMRRAPGPGNEARNDIYYTGNYGTWEQAQAQADGYDAPVILERVRAAAGRVRDGLAAFERDGVTFARPQPPWPLFACLARVAAACGGRLHVLDFGGSLGSRYFRCRDFFRGLAGLRWCVVEQPHFVACGGAEFQTDELAFYAGLDECLAREAVNVVLLSGVLPYLPEPYACLGDLLDRGLPFVLIDRTPFLESGPDRLTVESVPEQVYGQAVRYPAWLFDPVRWDRVMSARYRLLAAFPSDEDGLVALEDGATARFLGQFWQRNPGGVP